MADTGIVLEHFRRLRRKARLDQMQASRSVGKDHCHCGLVEKGRHGIPTEIFRRYMILFGAKPFEILNCLDLNPFDGIVLLRFEQACKRKGKDPVKTLENLMRFYVQ